VPPSGSRVHAFPPLSARDQRKPLVSCWTHRSRSVCVENGTTRDYGVLMAVARLLRLQIATTALCVAGCLGDIVWYTLARLIGDPDWPSWVQPIFVLSQFAGAGMAMCCWWQWRRVSQDVSEPSLHCAFCLHLIAGERCTECGASCVDHADGALLPRALMLRSSESVRGWLLMSALLTAMGAVVMASGVSDVLLRDRALFGSLHSAMARTGNFDSHMPTRLIYAGFAAVALRGTVQLHAAYRSAARASTASR